MDSIYGPDQVLFNGIYPEDYARDAIGHPYLKEKLFFPGSITIHNLKYMPVFLKYDLFKQQVIISRDGNENTPQQVIPPVEFISGFIINDKLFRKYAFGEPTGYFYQVVYDGDVKCLFLFSKERYLSYHNPKIVSYHYTEEQKKSFLLMDQNLHSFKSLKSFLSCFPPKIRPEIKAFCKKEKLNLSKSTDKQIGKLMEFCDKRLSGW